jgi:hypothetical protein
MLCLSMLAESRKASPWVQKVFDFDDDGDKVHM